MAHSTPQDDDGDYVTVAPGREGITYVSVGHSEEQVAAGVTPAALPDLIRALAGYLPEGGAVQALDAARDLLLPAGRSERARQELLRHLAPTVGDEKAAEIAEYAQSLGRRARPEAGSRP